MSLQLKIISIVLVSSLITFFSLIYFILSYQEEVFFRIFQQQAFGALNYLQTSFTSSEDLKNEAKLQETISRVTYFNPDIIKVNINLFEKEKLKTAASLDSNLIGKECDLDNYAVFQSTEFLSQELKEQQGKIFRITAPIHLSGVKYGTYDVGLSLAPFGESLKFIKEKVLTIMAAGLILLILIFYLFFKKIILDPIDELKTGVQVFAKGKFNYRIEKKSSDEIGELTQSFNQMAKEIQKSYSSLEEIVKERTKKLEEAKTILEIKIGARTRELQELNKSLERQVQEKTKELQEKLEELERFNKLAVGRELRMIELKEEIKRLKEELG